MIPFSASPETKKTAWALCRHGCLLPLWRLCRCDQAVLHSAAATGRKRGRWNFSNTSRIDGRQEPFQGIIQGIIKFRSNIEPSRMAVGQNLVPLVNIKIAGKWMFIPLKMVLIDIDPSPYHHLQNRTPNNKNRTRQQLSTRKPRTSLATRFIWKCRPRELQRPRIRVGPGRMHGFAQTYNVRPPSYKFVYKPQ